MTGIAPLTSGKGIIERRLCCPKRATFFKRTRCSVVEFTADEMTERQSVQFIET